MDKAYILEDSDGEEYMLVVRSADLELLMALARRMSRMRDERLKTLGKGLEEDLNGKR